MSFDHIQQQLPVQDPLELLLELLLLLVLESEEVELDDSDELEPDDEEDDKLLDELLGRTSLSATQ